MAMVAPSILSADFSRLGEEINRIQDAGCDWIHMDVMDGAFVPNISFGLPVIKGVKQFKKVPYDVHLMIEHPEQFVEQFRNAGADVITVHAEATKHLNRLVHQIQQTGAKAGVALNPATPLSAAEEILGDADMILLMSVNPGFGGQKYIPSVTDKLERLRIMREKGRYSFLIEVDGGIDGETGRLAASAGADVLVAGSYVFGHRDAAEAVSVLHAFGNKTAKI